MRYIFFGLLVVLIVIRYISSQHHFVEGERVRITTKVSSEPVQYSNGVSIKVLSLSTTLPIFTDIEYGDQIVMEGEVAGNKLQNPTIISISKRPNFFVSFKKRLMALYQESLPEPHAALVAGITIGAKSSLPKDFWEDLRRTGTAHVVVASGTNIAMVITFVMALLASLKSKVKAAAICLVLIFCYTFIVGFDAPIVRAAIMGSVGLVGSLLERKGAIWQIFFLTALVMLVVKPLWVSDLGFILSFVATASLMLFQKKVDSYFSFLPGFFREGFATSLAAQIGVAPIIYFTFGQFNLLSPIINALILWTIPFIMVIGVAGGFVGLILEPLGSAILLMAYPFTWWFTFVVNAL